MTDSGFVARSVSGWFGLFFLVGALALPVCPALGQDDSYEPNNDVGSAMDVQAYSGTWLSNISGLGIQCDADWYGIAVADGYERLTVECLFAGARGNIGIDLYDSNTMWLASVNSYEDSVLLDYAVPTGGSYYVQISGANRCS